MSASGGIILLAGRSYSGKSTVAAELAAAFDAVLLGFDAINAERGLVAGSDIPAEEWVATFRDALARAGRALDDGRVAVVDDTSSPRFLRDEWRALAAGRSAPFVLVHVAASEATVRERARANRAQPTRHDVSEAVLDRHLADFEPPAEDEPHLIASSDGRPLGPVVAAIAAALARAV